MKALYYAILTVSLVAWARLDASETHLVTDLASVTIEGASDQHNIGFHLDGCGDVNGDGIGDFVVGTRRMVGENHSNTGYLLLGSHGIASTIDMATPPEGTTIITHDHLGGIAVAASDFNGDGLSDIVFGDSLGSPFGIELAGRVVLLFGSETLPQRIGFDEIGAPGVAIPGYRRNGGLGYRLSRAGDVNGDGLADLLIGSPGRYLPTDEQEAFLIYGATDLPPSLDLTDLGPRGVRMVGRNFGWDVAGAGDVNDDGLDDILIGAVGNADGILGHSCLIYGATDLPAEIEESGIPLFGIDFVGHEIGDGFGQFVSGAGDINDDGYDDILLSAWDASPNGVSEAGIAYVVFGGSSLPSILNVGELGEGGITIHETKLMGRFGRTLASVGDINFDGIDDCLFSSEVQNLADDNAFILLGSRDLPRGGPYVKSDFEHVKLVSPVPTSGFCARAAQIGDVNGDGLKDLIIGDPAVDPNDRFVAGEAYIIYGGTLFPPPPDVDLNNDGVIDAKDLFLFQKQWKR